MAKVSRFTISLPAALLEAVDQKLVNGDLTRSEVVRRLLEKAVRDEQEREDVEAWVRSYTENPETEDELGWADVAVLEAQPDLPWK